MDNKAMYKLTYGLFVLSVNDNGKQNGCIINTATQVTSEPNRISIAVNQSNYTHDLLMRNKVFNLSILNQEAEFELFRRFGFQSGREVDKFADFDAYKMAENGVNYITAGTNAYISAVVEQTVDLGTHTLFIASVTDMEILNDVPSASYEYYQQNIKPAPTEATSEKKTVYRCTVCGYEYEGEKLPEDFICPWCKHPASDFEKMEN